MIRIKSPKEIQWMRESGKLAAKILKEAIAFTQIGITTNQINELVHDITTSNGAYPSPLNYRGFPKSVCTSVNDVVTHGIPSNYELKNGDIVNIDVTCNLKGYHGDTSATVILGEVPDETKELIDVSEKCLYNAIEICKPGAFFSDIGRVIQDITDDYGYGVVEEYCGHGIGRNFHEDPMVLHYRTKNRGPRMEEGHVFTIEPMINMGIPQTKLLDDGWTVVTADGALSAQFEHTIAILRSGHEILTLDPKDKK